MPYISFQHPGNGIPVTVTYHEEGGTLSVDDQLDEFFDPSEEEYPRLRGELDAFAKDLSFYRGASLLEASEVLRIRGVSIRKEGGWSV